MTRVVKPVESQTTQVTPSLEFSLTASAAFCAATLSIFSIFWSPGAHLLLFCSPFNGGSLIRHLRSRRVSRGLDASSLHHGSLEQVARWVACPYSQRWTSFGIIQMILTLWRRGVYCIVHDRRRIMIVGSLARGGQRISGLMGAKLARVMRWHAPCSCSAPMRRG